MRVEYLLPAIVLSLAMTGCGDDSGNVMAPNANALEPAVIEAALGPEPASAPEANGIPANEAADTSVTTNEAPAAPSEVSTEAAAEPAAEGETDTLTDEGNSAE